MIFKLHPQTLSKKDNLVPVGYLSWWGSLVEMEGTEA